MVPGSADAAGAAGAAKAKLANASLREREMNFIFSREFRVQTTLDNSDAVADIRWKIRGGVLANVWLWGLPSQIIYVLKLMIKYMMVTGGLDQLTSDSSLHASGLVEKQLLYGSFRNKINRTVKYQMSGGFRYAKNGPFEWHSRRQPEEGIRKVH